MEYPGIEPFFYLMLKDPNGIWNDHVDHGSLEEAAAIWEKLNLSPKRKLTPKDQAFIFTCEDALPRYTRLVHWYNTWSEEEKDKVCSEWNAICPAL